MGSLNRKFRFLILLFAAALFGCASTSTQSLFNQIGGEQKLQAIVESMIQEIGHDTQIFHYFADTNISRFRQQLYDHLCAVSNGPCKYEGDTMIDVHAGMNINEADFNHIVEILILAMNQNNISHTTQNKLIAKLAPMRKEIIYQ